MLLFEIIRDFFVNLIFGGTNSQGEQISCFIFGDAINGYDMSTYNTFMKSPFINDGEEVLYWSLGDYLSTIASIITIIAILLFCVFIIKKIIGIIFRLFTGSSSF